MYDVTTLFREYAHLDLRRLNGGLSVVEHERWAILRATLDKQLGPRKKPNAPSNRRSARRVATRLKCSYAGDADRRDAVVSNLSTGGVFIRTDWPLPLGSELEIEIRLEKTGRVIGVRGVVVSTNVDASVGARVPGMGVRFTRVDPDVLAELSSVYSEAIARESKTSRRITTKRARRAGAMPESGTREAGEADRRVRRRESSGC